MIKTKIKKLKKVPSNLDDKDKNYVAVLVEDMRSNFKAFGEDLSLTRETIKTEIKDFKKEVNSKFEMVFGEIKGIHKEMGEVKEDMNEGFDEVDYKFEGVFDELRLIRNELKEKVGRDEFLVLEKRMTILERKFAY